ncbi:MAG: hypothetical protein GY722_19315, partial [bacterium]|nr:hypothetical protein [bacterium]
EDNTPPEIHEIFLEDGHLEITLSETPDLALAPAALEIDGAAIAWMLKDDAYTLRSQDPVPTGVHSLHVVPGSPIDLAGLGVAELFELEFTVQDPVPLTAGSQKALDPLSSLLFKLPEGNFVPVTERGNRHTFHGRPVDPETGFIYFRNRYLDPELGRFITTDPMGYADAPSLYQFALNNPVDFSDPTGEIAETWWDAASLTIGVASLTHNLYEQNYGMAALDAFGVVVDGLAVATPILPGGVGIALKTKRATDTLRKAQLVDQALNVSQGMAQAVHEVRNESPGWGLFYGGMSLLGIRQ